ncbi:MAG TPA: transketolase C-terminal domain-containing protein, partial [Methylovirgula sp.]
DSIGLGEDGPTHQPVETLASLRVIPHLNVFRPADAIETAEAWELALQLSEAPSVLALSRQNLPVLRRTHTNENLSAKGAYVLREVAGERDVTLIATGSEVSLAVAAADELAKDSVKAAVISLPCFELFAAQEPGYRAAVLGQAPRIGIEAALRQGWGAVLAPEDYFIGMKDFGASAPAADLYKHFGITVEAIVSAARAAAGHGTAS